LENRGPNFEALKRFNVYGVEYWSARELQPLLGYDLWQNFEKVIKKAMVAATAPELHIRPQDHFTEIEEVTRKGKGKGSSQTRKNYFLSKKACHLIAQCSDPKKPEIKAAMNFFSFTADFYEMAQLYKEQEERLQTRLKVSESYKALGEAASVSGVDSEFFGIFIDAGYIGLHHASLAELLERKGISEGEDYLDNITREELSAIDFKNVQTEAKLLREQIQGNEKATQAHHFVGDQVRKAIAAIHAPMPETLPTAPSIRKLVEAHRRKVSKRKQKVAEQQQSSYAQDGLFDQVKRFDLESGENPTDAL
jgi:DNA-damage-inducible protein D